MNVNSVSFVKPYSVISDDATQQPINTNPKSVNFKGAIGDSLLKEVTTSKTVPSIDTVLSRIKGTFGLNADKTKDVLESFRNMIEKLVHAKNDLALKNHNANNVIQSLKEQVQKLKSEKDELIISMREMIAAKDKTHADEMFAKNKEIADLNKYADMVKVKSVEEIGVIMPKDAISALNEYKENHDAACKSMLEYLMTGKGQEAAVKQAELSNVIYAAIQENLTEIPEVKKVYEELREKGFSVGGDAFSNDIGLIEKVLQVSDDGAYIFASKIREQIETNIMAMLKSHSTKFNYDCKPLLDDIAQFHRNVIKNKDELAKSGWECTGKTIVDYHPLKSYYTFVNKQDGTIWDLSIADTACHYFVCGRRTDADGKVSGTIVSWKLG